MYVLYIQIESELVFHPQPHIYCNTESGILRIKYFHTFLSSVKGKAIPLQAWTGPEGSRRLRLPDFKTVGT